MSWGVSAVPGFVTWELLRMIRGKSVCEEKQVLIPGAAQLFGSGEALGGLGCAVGWSPACASPFTIPSCSSRTEQGWQLWQELLVWEMGSVLLSPPCSGLLWWRSNADLDSPCWNIITGRFYSFNAQNNYFFLTVTRWGFGLPKRFQFKRCKHPLSLWLWLISQATNVIMGGEEKSPSKEIPSGAEDAD